MFIIIDDILRIIRSIKDRLGYKNMYNELDRLKKQILEQVTDPQKVE